MSDLHFSLPLESTVDLAKRLLVVEIQEDTLDGPAQTGKGFAFVHSCHRYIRQDGQCWNQSENGMQEVKVTAFADDEQQPHLPC
jgi:hypothetical protein